MLLPAIVTFVQRNMRRIYEHPVFVGGTSDSEEGQGKVNFIRRSTRICVNYERKTVFNQILCKQLYNNNEIVFGDR